MPVAHAATDFSGLSSNTQMVSQPEVVPVTSIDPDQREQDFNSGWKFNLGDISDAQAPNFDDSKWRNVTLPHDYSIEQSFTKSGEAESGYLLGGVGWYRKSVLMPNDVKGKRINLNFDGIYMDATIYVNGVELANHPYGYTPFSVDITSAVKPGENNVIAIKVNHQTPSSRWYSGSGIYRDVELSITDPVHVGYNGVTVVADDIDAYTGSGILNLSASTIVANEGTDDETVTVTTTVLPKAGGEAIGSASASISLPAGSSATASATISADSPKLWTLKDPQLYTVKTEVSHGTTIVDTQEMTTGFRKIEFDADDGFKLNGEAVKLKGVSMHHDQGALGAAAYEAAIARQLDILKEMGVNSVRVTHNPAAKVLIDLANEKGILIIEEIFDGLHCPKNNNTMDYARFFEKSVPTGTALENVSTDSTWARFDLETTIRRDINAPSVIMWSLGNEIQEGTSCGIGSFVDNQADLVTWAAGVDKTRPVTRGDNAIKRGGIAINVMQRLLDKAADEGVVGTVGANYASAGQYTTLHEKYPNAMLYGSETASAVNSRGVYDRTTDSGQTADKQLTSYDGSTVGWGMYAAEAWYDVVQFDYVAGTYIWTGFDYIGEPTNWNGIGPGAVGAWPSPKNSFFGIIDTAGLPKDSYYFYQSQWNDDVNTLHILPAWNKSVLQNDGNGSQKVVVYSDAKKVELFFTPAGSTERESLGAKEFTTKTTPNGYEYQMYEGKGKSSRDYENMYLSWSVPYADGTLTAVAYDAHGNVISDTVGRSSVTTAGAATKLNATVDRQSIAANGKDLSYITVEVQDEDGNLVPDAGQNVTFEVSGDGVLMGTDNGKQADHTSYQSPSRDAYHGKLIAIVKSTTSSGEFTVTATADGLESSSVTVKTTVVPTEKIVEQYVYPRNFYVLQGVQPVLPTQIDAIYSDGATTAVDVTWDTISEEQINKLGAFSVTGTTAAGDDITANITMLDRIGTVLNYSATTPVGVVPSIPEQRLAVMPDATVLNTQFAVAWDLPAETVYDVAGTVTINGTASVFGEEYPVTATIRVQEPAVEIGASVSGAATVTQDIPADRQSDTLTAIIDGDTTVSANTGGGSNPTAWTNYTNSQNPNADNTAEITFEYATQQTFGEFDVFFYKDSYSARYPDAGSTHFYVKDNVGDEWRLVEATEIVDASDSSTNVRRYSYELSEPIRATFVKLAVTNKDEELRGRNACTGIAEVELRTATTNTNVYTTPGIDSLEVNGESVPQTAIDAWAYQTAAERVVSLNVAAKENSGITVLPAYEGVVRIIVEAEDHSARQVFEIILGEEPTMAADDASLDVDPTTMKIEVDNSSATDVKENALDGDPTTLWHTNWRPNPLGSDPANIAAKGWAVLILDEATEIEALRYLPRSKGGANGIITKYEVWVSNTDAPAGVTLQNGVTLPAEDQYVKAAEGAWTQDSQWKIAQFAEATMAKYVLLRPIESVTDQGTFFVSAAELRLRGVKETISLNDPNLAYSVTINPNVVEVETVSAANPVILRDGAMVVKDKDDNVLTEGVNYRVKYTGNDSPGVATVIIEGMNTHSGMLEASFTVKLVGAVNPGVPMPPSDPSEPTSPTEPASPTEPDDPTEPTSPTEPASPPESTNSDAGNPPVVEPASTPEGENTLVKTGANAMLAACAALILVAGGVIVLVARRRNA